MGDVSLIARRKAAKSVEFGWSGNGGYFTMLGDVLLTYYQSPKMVNYLFSLGQFSLLREPLSEWETGIWRTRPTGEPHWQGTSELEIYDHLLFVDCAYFYDLDGRWYYVAPKAFNVKMPLELVGNNLDDEAREYAFLHTVEQQIIRTVTQDWYTNNAAFRAYAEANGYDTDKMAALETELCGSDAPLYDFMCKHRRLHNYFDYWVVIKATEDNQKIEQIMLREKGEEHVETIEW